MTWYRKYRPQTVAELDLKSVREALEKALAAKELPHAWLFTGPRGIGKTSAARIVAKFVNCEGRQGRRPCNECDMCREITAGTAPDVVEIDAASNRGIDEIRDLREKVKLAPMRAKYKVYIIDEVHMLTTEAANALLKTLEEPPGNVMFILCTTEAEKLLPTVVSRCTRIRFYLPNDEEILGKLERVAKAEDLRIKAEELRLIAKAARGSFRDGIKILEQANAGGGAAAVLGVVEGVEAEDFVNAVMPGAREEALGMIDKLVQGGGNVRSFIEKCVEYCRERMLEEKLDRKWIDVIEGLEKAYEQTKTAAVVQLPLEIFVIKSTSAAAPAEAARPGSGGVGQKPKEVKRSDDGGKYKLEDVVGRWSEIMKVVKPKNHSVEALLRSTRPVDFDGARLELEVFYKFHKDKLETEKCREIVESSVTEVLGGKPVKLELKLGERKLREASGGPKEEISGDVDQDIVRAAAEIFKVETI